MIDILDIFDLPEQTEEIVIWDVECTSWKGSAELRWGRPGEYRELVEIGAIKVHLTSLTEIDSFSQLVKPEINPELSKYFMNLTHISQAMLDEKSIPFSEALEKFQKFCNLHPLFSWSHFDKQVLLENCLIHSMKCSLTHDSFFDVRYIFFLYGVRIEKFQSSTITQAFNKTSPYVGHRAINDCRTILDALRELDERAKAV